MSRKSTQSIWKDTALVLNLIQDSKHVADLLTRLGLPLNSTSYRNARTFAAKNDVKLPRLSSTDRSARMRKQNSLLRVPIDELFCENSLVNRNTLKRRALQEGYLEYKCYGKTCQTNGNPLNTWQGLVLQLEHKNGICNDNRIENLELLCPNCHSMTATYGNGNQMRYENGSHGYCEQCKRPSKTKRCLRCVPAKRRLDSISIESLANDILERGVRAVASDFELSDSVLLSEIRKRQDKISKIVGVAEPDRKGTIEYPPIDELVDKVLRDGYLKVAQEIGVSDNGLRKHIKKSLGKDLVTKRSHSKIK